MTAVRAWWGRVFALGGPGGNHTAVVLPGAQVERPADLAARLAVPDTGFVVNAGPDAITLRTFSPVEELHQCLQTSLAALSALEVPLGEPRLVRHERGEPLEVHREKELTWARETVERPFEADDAPWPGFVTADPAPGAGAILLRGARSRIHLRLADHNQLLAVNVASEDVLALCEATGTNGLVLSAVDDAGVHRVRVFTTSLAGQEDNATGGAVLGVGRIAAAQGLRGDLTVIQGPADLRRQGRLALRLGSNGQVLLGGSVEPLMVGELAW